MLEETIAKIESQIRASESINEERREELLKLLAELKTEVGSLSETDLDQARSITGFTELSAHEAMRSNQNPRLLETSLSGLSSSVDGFEKSHPRLVQIVNTISNTLSNLGI